LQVRSKRVNRIGDEARVRQNRLGRHSCSSCRNSIPEIVAKRKREWCSRDVLRGVERLSGVGRHDAQEGVQAFSHKCHGEPTAKDGLARLTTEFAQQTALKIRTPVKTEARRKVAVIGVIGL